VLPGVEAESHVDAHQLLHELVQPEDILYIEPYHTIPNISEADLRVCGVCGVCHVNDVLVRCA